jgi:hypothetical protein
MLDRAALHPAQKRRVAIRVVPLLVNFPSRAVVTAAGALAVALLAVSSAWAAAPANVTVPSVAGVGRVGETLTARTGDWSGEPSGYAYQWERCTVPAGTYKENVLADSPVAYYRLGEVLGSSALDSASGGVAGAYGGGVTQGGASALNDDADPAGVFSTGNVSVADRSALRPASVTVEAWIKTSGSPWSVPYIAAKARAGGTLSYGLQMTDTSKVLMSIQSAGGTFYQAVSTTSVEDNVWHHVAGTFDGSSVRLYVDGTLQATTAAAITIPYDATDLTIGRYHPSHNGFGFGGSIERSRSTRRR